MTLTHCDTWQIIIGQGNDSFWQSKPSMMKDHRKAKLGEIYRLVTPGDLAKNSRKVLNSQDSNHRSLVLTQVDRTSGLEERQPLYARQSPNLSVKLEAAKHLVGELLNLDPTHQAMVRRAEVDETTSNPHLHEMTPQVKERADFHHHHHLLEAVMEEIMEGEMIPRVLHPEVLVTKELVEHHHPHHHPLIKEAEEEGMMEITHSEMTLKVRMRIAWHQSHLDQVRPLQGTAFVSTTDNTSVEGTKSLKDIGSFRLSNLQTRH